MSAQQELFWHLSKSNLTLVETYTEALNLVWNYTKSARMSDCYFMICTGYCPDEIITVWHLTFSDQFGLDCCRVWFLVFLSKCFCLVIIFSGWKKYLCLYISKVYMYNQLSSIYLSIHMLLRSALYSLSNNIRYCNVHMYIQLLKKKCK